MNHAHAHGIAEDSRFRTVAYTQLSSTEEDGIMSDADGQSEKTFTVEQAVERLGFGRFQLKILLASGIMAATDAMEMMLLAFLGPALRCEWHLTSSQVAAITTLVFVGILLGAPFWGAISDKLGRWGVSAITLVLMAYFGLLCACSPNYIWVIFLRGLVGFNISGSASSFTLVSEYLPQKHRAKVLIVHGLFWGVGSTFEIVLAYWVLNTLGWRYLTALSTLPLIASLPTLAYLPESARYLMVSGQTETATAVIDQIARENGKKLMKGNLTAQTGSDAHRGRLGSLFHQPYRRTTLILFTLWFGVAFSYYGIVLVSAEIFHFHRDCPSQKEPFTAGQNTSKMISDSSCCRILQREDYEAMFVSSLGEFLILPFLILTVDWLGRKWTLSINYLLIGVSFSLLNYCVPKTMTSILMLMARAHACGVFKIIYIYTTEVYPTVVRNIGLGVCSSIARLGSMIAPFVAQVVLPDVSAGAGFFTFASVGFGCFFLSLLLPIETRGRALPQTLGLTDPETADKVVNFKTNSDGSCIDIEIRMQGKVD